MTLCYDGTDALHRYVESDFTSDVDSRKSTTTYVFTLEIGEESWELRLHKVVTLSMTEAEYIAAIEVYKELIWLKNFMKDLGKEQVTPSLHSDSQSAIDLANNSDYHDKTKHIDVQYHFIHNLLKDDMLSLVKIHTSQNLADMLTKLVMTEKLETCSASVGLLG